MSVTSCCFETWPVHTCVSGLLGGPYALAKHLTQRGIRVKRCPVHRGIRVRLGPLLAESAGCLSQNAWCRWCITRRWPSARRMPVCEPTNAAILNQQHPSGRELSLACASAGHVEVALTVARAHCLNWEYAHCMQNGSLAGTTRALPGPHHSLSLSRSCHRQCRCRTYPTCDDSCPQWVLAISDIKVQPTCIYQPLLNALN